MSDPTPGDGPDRSGAAGGPEPGPAPPFYYDERDEISLVQLVNVFLRHRWKVLATPVVLALLVGTHTLVQPTTWTSRVSFIPEMGEGASASAGLSGLASRLGVSVPGTGGRQVPQFYADLLTSRRILDAAVRTPFALPGGSGGVPDAGSDGAGDAGSGQAAAGPGAGRTLLDLWQIQADTEAERVAAGAARLRGSLQVSTDLETGLVEASVTTGDPRLSRRVMERLVELVNQFNTETRQSQAAAEAGFVQARLRETRDELRAAEDSLERFLERNRRFENLPELRFEHDRLQRQVQLKQSIHNSLAQSYERARIDQVRSTPVITVVETPILPTEPDGDRLGLKLALGLVLGGMLGVFWAFGSEFLGNVREEEPEEYETFEALRREAAGDLRRAGARLRRLVGRGVGE